MVVRTARQLLAIGAREEGVAGVRVVQPLVELDVGRLGQAAHLVDELQQTGGLSITSRRSIRDRQSASEWRCELKRSAAEQRGAERKRFDEGGGLIGGERTAPPAPPLSAMSAMHPALSGHCTVRQLMPSDW